MINSFNVWIYWDSGIDNAPELIKASVRSAKINSRCNVNVISSIQLTQMLPEVDEQIFNALRPAHQADVFRLNVLYKYGGMYIDADTIVMESLIPLFKLLDTYELIGADWKPRRYPSWKEELGNGVIGPVRIGNDFIGRCKDVQNLILENKKHNIMEFPWQKGLPNSNYCLEWEEILGRITARMSKQYLANCLVFDGASSWYTYVGGPSWPGGDGGHLYRKLMPDETIPYSPLYTYSHSLAPNEILKMDIPEILKKEWILSELLRRSGI